jgi:hypothetical protein
MTPRKPIEFYIDENGCHVCTSHRRTEFGHIEINRFTGWGTGLLHRIIYMEKFGRIEPDQIVRHTCDNPSCINIDHLILGTHADNVADRVSRNRSALGVNNGRSKLTAEQAVEIFKNTTMTNTELGKYYSIDPAVIRKIKKRLLWKSATELLA